MQEKARYFHADYRDGRVHIGGKVYQAGVFATHLLNQYYKDDTAARIAVFTTDNHFIRKKLSTGYIKVRCLRLWHINAPKKTNPPPSKF